MSQETELHMVQRHIREGASIIERQGELVRRTISRGGDDGQAVLLLGLFEEIQRLHEDHLERLYQRLHENGPAHAATRSATVSDDSLEF